MDILIFALIAAGLFYRLYLVLGREEDAPLERKISPTYEPVTDIKPNKVDRTLRKLDLAAFLKPKLSAIVLKDPSFDVSDFLDGAKGAYELILTRSFEKDLASIQTYVSPAVLEQLSAFEQQQGMKIRIQDCQLIDADFQNPIATLTVQFQARLQGRTSTWSRSEDWVFSRNLESDKLVWILEKIIPLS